jgi:thiosulfate/3-mercaptopyruvate sulfurtransferase
MSEYAHPETLVSTQWVLEHAKDPNVRVVEVDVDVNAYNEGHVPGSIAWAWTTQLADTVRRDILSKPDFEALRIMNGGRKKWLAEARELTTDVPTVKPATYKAAAPDLALRAFLPQAQAASDKRAAALVDVRSPQEFTGEVLSPPGLPETCQRGGHIPGARSIPWGKACNDDGSFKSADELRNLYAAEGVDGAQPVIAYCRIGERSSHTWFVLKYLLGYKNVANYDGSWTEWGNLVGAPVERGAAAPAAEKVA